MVKGKKSILLIVSILSLVILGCSDKKNQQLPNVVILYADDLGWSDLACYGSIKNETPNLDKLANEGIQFSNAYAPAPICSASRASIMTGKTPARLQFEFVSTAARITDKLLLPPKRTLELTLNEITVAELAKNAGYTTGMFGKWHIAKHNGAYLKWSDTHGPFQQGFQNGTDHFGSHPYNEKNRELVDLNEGDFPIDSLVVHAIEFLENQKEKSQPFFMFFSSYFVHTPVLPNNAWLIKKYKIKMPEASENEIKYAAFVESMDHYFGQLLKALKDFGFEKNTLVIFTSDNGGHPAYTKNYPLRGNKWNLYEGGIREPFLVRWPQLADKATVCDEPIIQWDILPTLCDIWEQAIPENVDGESLFPLIKGNSLHLKRKSLFWHFPYYHPPKSYEGTKPCSAIREGNYKLIYFYEDERVELYNLENDLQEKTDLSLEMPKLTARLKSELLSKLDEANARFATPNPGYKE